MSQNELFNDGVVKQDVVNARTISVLVPYPVDKAYDYIIPEDFNVADGDYVLVPLGGREVTAVVWGQSRGDVKPEKLKSIIHKFDLPPMDVAHREFIAWTARYNMAPLGFVLKMALSAPGGLEPPVPAKGYRLKDGFELLKLTAKQKAVVQVLHDNVSRIAADIAREAEVSSGVVKALFDKGVLECVDIYNPAPCIKPDPYRQSAELSEDQAYAADGLCDFVRSGSYKAVLLDGVTGAGKTEVYFEAVAEALKSDKQVCILLPEIALSNAFFQRFKERFGCAPALWHSHLSKGQRDNTWRGVARGHTKVVIGARSALYLPYRDLGLIVIDEEHDPAYKQEDGVIYHARDMAIMRAFKGSFPIVLVSATPSVETMQNVWDGKYEHMVLPSRFGGAHMPDIEAIDMRLEKLDAQHFISFQLRQAMEETLERGEQILLFLNRRGYAPLTLCRSCGHRMECPRCTAWLVEHKVDGGQGRLQCHHCGFHAYAPDKCPECAEPDSMVACGPGVERIYAEAQHYFPDANVMLLASDTAEDGETLKAMLSDIREGRVDIVIGTQIIAKGHHFPNLTLVGVVDADLGLQGGELRASERVYQLLHQVAGRAGRAAKKGRVLLQSFMPDHRIIKALCESSHGDGRDAFIETEVAEREMAHMPPFSRLAGIVVSGRDEAQVFEVAKLLGRSAPQGPEIVTLGPAPAPYAKLRGKFRYRLLVQASKNLDLQKTLAAWVAGVKVPSTVRVYIDIDPQSFL